MLNRHSERHRTSHFGWLRAAVLGANDGIISTASLIIGVAAAQTSHSGILVAGSAALVAGAMSMAAGEYVSVSSQADSEKAELEIEQKELDTDPIAETKELTDIYRQRGLNANLANQVAETLMQHDALAAHAREELGILEVTSAKPIQAAISSAISFIIGAALPLLIVLFISGPHLILTVSIASLFFLSFLGAIAAKIGRANAVIGTIRVTFWGALAMAVTAGIGYLFGTVV